jgi:hypothetical protein
MERMQLLSPLIHDYVTDLLANSGEEQPLFRDMYIAVKKMIRPIVPANRDIDGALVPFFRRKKQGKPGRRRRPRGGGQKPAPPEEPAL